MMKRSIIEGSNMFWTWFVIFMSATLALGKYKIRVKFNQLDNWKDFIKDYGALVEMA